MVSGGLIAGVAIAAKCLKPNIKIIVSKLLNGIVVIELFLKTFYHGKAEASRPLNFL